MRGVVYGIAVIAAVGIMVVIATSGDQVTEDPSGQSLTSNATAVSVDPATMEEAGTLTLAVPEMHCAFSCFPKVKNTLEDDANVESVELGPQETEGVLDNRQVVVQYKAGFEVDQAIKMLAAKGFTDSQKVE